MNALLADGRTRLVVDVEKRLDSFRVQVRLEIGAEIMVLFGPSGAGKTTILNAIAGILAPDAGEISLDGRPLFRKHRPGGALNVPTRHRHIGYVFQNYALFPHLTALENVAYPLWRQKDGIRQANALLAQMHLGHLADRYPRELSGGQQQRVAIARALAADPEVLLLDEPFSALDTAVRERLQRDLMTLHRELGLVVVYVTHQLEDAFALGDRLAVVREGRVEQVGPIAAVFRYPTNHNVAKIMGIRNLFRARVMEVGPDRLILDWDGMRLDVPPQSAEPGTTVTAYIRPEDVKLLYPDRPIMGAVAHNRVTGRVRESGHNASLRIVQVLLPNGHAVEVRFPAYAYVPLRLLPGDAVQLSLRKEGIVIVRERGDIGK